MPVGAVLADEPESLGYEAVGNFPLPARPEWEPEMKTHAQNLTGYPGPRGTPSTYQRTKKMTQTIRTMIV